MAFVGFGCLAMVDLPVRRLRRPVGVCPLSGSEDAMQFSQLQLTSIGLKFRFGRKCTLLFDDLLLAFWTNIWYAFGRRMKIWSNAGLRMM